MFCVTHVLFCASVLCFPYRIVWVSQLLLFAFSCFWIAPASPIRHACVVFRLAPDTPILGYRVGIFVKDNIFRTIDTLLSALEEVDLPRNSVLIRPPPQVQPGARGHFFLFSFSLLAGGGGGEGWCVAVFFGVLFSVRHVSSMRFIFLEKCLTCAFCPVLAFSFSLLSFSLLITG